MQMQQPQYAQQPVPQYGQQPMMQQQPMMMQAVTVPNVAQGVVSQQQDFGNQWQQGLCGCCSDLPNCLCSFCCTPCAAADARTKYDESNMCFNICALTSCSFYNIIREGYGIEGNCMTDIFYGLCCIPCIVAQARNEVKVRGSGKSAALNGSNRWAKDPVVAACSWPNWLLYCLCGPIASCWFLADGRARYDGSNRLFNCCCVSPVLNFNLIREGYDIEGNCCADIIYGTYCCPLAAAMVKEHVDADIAAQNNQS